MGNKPEGPYFNDGEDIYFGKCSPFHVTRHVAKYTCASEAVSLANIAYKAGRASRDGLREALSTAYMQYRFPERFPPEFNHWSAIASNALAADEEAGK